MLPNPLTPPQDDSFETGSNNAATPAQSNSIFATPVSYNYMDVDGSNSNNGSSEHGVGYDAEYPEPSSDEDMSDGGAALSLTESSTQAQNEGMHDIDAEAAAENLLGLSQSAILQPTHVSSASLPQPSEPVHNQEMFEEIWDSENDGGSEQSAIFQSLATISGVAQQLQHLQDAQEHLDVLIAPDPTHNFINNSTTPFLSSPVQPSTTASLNQLPTDEGSFVSMVEVSIGNSIPVNTPSQNAPHLWSTEGWNPTPAFDIIMSPPLPLNDAQVPQAEVLGFWTDNQMADQDEVEDRFNLSLGDFLYSWGANAGRHDSNEPRRRPKGPSLSELHAQRYVETLPPVKRKDLQGESCDIQRIDWKKLGVTRNEARQVRRQNYRNYTNLRPSAQWHPRLHGAHLADDRDYFRFRRTDFDHDVYLSHFQLRNLISCASRNHVFYAGRSKIHQWNPMSNSKGNRKVVMNLTNPIVQPLHSMAGGIQISTLTVNHDILVAGGFCGEYALVNLKAHKDTKHTEGIVTTHDNSITNHLQVHLSRTSYTPQVAIASNDNGMRILDVATNTFVADHSYDHAINCTAISPDQRLRVLVGDSRQVMICNADNGEILQSLDGHRDFGFACDWADDGWTVATGNQDMQIKIWDARKWTTSQGDSCPVTTIAADMAGVRKLKFSPLGSGKKVLVAAEPADIVSIIDAQSFNRKQTLNFFGEIGGFDFTNGGRDLIIANCDSMRGGLMEFERCDLSRGSLYELDDTYESMSRSRGRHGTGYDWALTDEDVTDDYRSYGTLHNRKNNTTLLGSDMGHF